MLKIIKRPVFTVKTINLLEKFSQYVFEVDVKLNKLQVRLLIEKIFFVHVCSVNMHRRKCKKSNKIKLAYITIAKNEKIVFF
jgi:large subunit ribosomal protein L23